MLCFCKTGLIVPLLLGVLSVGVSRAQDPTNNIIAGKSRFAQTCGFCHGPDGRGGASGPDLIRSSLVSHDVDGNLIGDVVRNGRPDKGMPAFQLADSEIKNIALYLHAEAHNAANVARQIPTEYPLSKLLVGDAAAGKRYFGSHCAACHSPEGDLAHVATKYKPFDLQTRIAFPSGRKPTAEIKDQAGRSASGEVTYLDEFVISVRRADGSIQTWPRGGGAAITITDPLAEHERLLHAYSDADLHDLFAYLETFK